MQLDRSIGERHAALASLGLHLLAGLVSNRRRVNDCAVALLQARTAFLTVS
jgi:hypothetical protein